MRAKSGLKAIELVTWILGPQGAASAEQLSVPVSVSVSVSVQKTIGAPALPAEIRSSFSRFQGPKGQDR
jgi:hypothetical protein